MIILFRFFKSVRLAIVLILYITASSIISSLIPQGEAVSFYYDNYSRIVSNLILFIGLNNFFQSIGFIFPVILLIINLGICAAGRFYLSFFKRKKLNIGPDIIHVGLILLIVGSLITFLGKTETSHYLAEGEQFMLPNGYILELKSFETLLYEDGRPKDWISTVDIYNDNEKIVNAFPIEVNHPLSVSGFQIYQVDYGVQEFITLADGNGKTVRLYPGELLSTDNADIYYEFLGIGKKQSDAAEMVFFQSYVQNKKNNLIITPFYSKIDDYQITAIMTRDLTGLNVVTDPGTRVVFISFILIFIGLVYTYVYKTGVFRK